MGTPTTFLVAGYSKATLFWDTIPRFFHVATIIMTLATLSTLALSFALRIRRGWLRAGHAWHVGRWWVVVLNRTFPVSNLNLFLLPYMVLWGILGLIMAFYPTAFPILVHDGHVLHLLNAFVSVLGILSLILVYIVTDYVRLSRRLWDQRCTALAHAFSLNGKLNRVDLHEDDRQILFFLQARNDLDVGLERQRLLLTMTGASKAHPCPSTPPSMPQRRL